MSLEDILAKYFGCKRPFLKTPIHLWENDYRYLTENGDKAYGKLIDLIHDLSALGISINADLVEAELDRILCHRD